MFKRFKQRASEPELMDDLSLKGPELKKNLDELEVINRLLGGNAVAIDALNYLVKQHPQLPIRSITIGDLGCGGGDLLREMAKWCQKKSIDAQFIGYDANPFMIDYSKKKAAEFSNIRFEQADIFSEDFHAKTFDILVCSLFCHHFSDEDLVRIFQQWKKQARFGVIINDLHRHWLAHHSIWALTRLLNGSRLVRHDAPLSVRRAFTRKELEMLLQRAHLQPQRLKWKWAFRFQVIF